MYNYQTELLLRSTVVALSTQFQNIFSRLVIKLKHKTEVKREFENRTCSPSMPEEFLASF